MPLPTEGSEHAFYRLYAYVRPSGLGSGWGRDRILAELNSHGVPAFHGSCSEVYLERALEGRPFKPANRLPVARELGDTSISFLVHPTLTAEDMERCRASIAAVFAEASA